MIKAAVAPERGPETSVCRFKLGTVQLEVVAGRTPPQEAPGEGTLARFEHGGVHYLVRASACGARVLDPLCEILTAREREIVRLVAAGLRNKQIAYDLRLSEYTVAAYIKHVCYKLQVRNRTAMVSRCSQLGAAPPGALARDACRQEPRPLP